MFLNKLNNSLQVIFKRHYVVGRWYNNKQNWGDAINPILVSALYGYKLIHSNFVFNVLGLPVYSCVGSILNVFTRNKNVVVWGSGVANPSKKLGYVPAKVCAVRGPLTLKYLTDNGVSCEPAFGDPVLLLKRVYNPIQITKKYKFGVINHYEDKTPLIDKLIAGRDDVLRISIIQDMNKPYHIIDQLMSCENIISSSLHGLILADLYEVPNAWVFIKGFEKSVFKFDDYYQASNIFTPRPTVIDDTDDIAVFENLSYQVNKVNIDLNRLYNSSPFKK